MRSLYTIVAMVVGVACLLEIASAAASPRKTVTVAPAGDDNDFCARKNSVKHNKLQDHAKKFGVVVGEDDDSYKKRCDAFYGNVREIESVSARYKHAGHAVPFGETKYTHLTKTEFIETVATGVGKVRQRPATASRNSFNVNRPSTSSGIGSSLTWVSSNNAPALWSSFTDFCVASAAFISSDSQLADAQSVFDNYASVGSSRQMKYSNFVGVSRPNKPPNSIGTSRFGNMGGGMGQAISAVDILAPASDSDGFVSSDLTLGQVCSLGYYGTLSPPWTPVVKPRFHHNHASTSKREATVFAAMNRHPWNSSLVQSCAYMFTIGADITLGELCEQWYTSFAPELPAINWLTSGAISPAIYDQGTCSNCWATAPVAAAEGCAAILNGKDPSTGKYSPVTLSVQQLTDCTPDSSCDGGDPIIAISRAVGMGGILPADAYDRLPKKSRVKPDNTPSSTCRVSRSTDFSAGFVPDSVPASRYAAAGLDNVVELIGNGISNDAIHEALSRAPVAVFIDPLILQNYNGEGPIDAEACAVTGPLVHMVQVVGYDPAGYFILKNSWGANWPKPGANGFFKVSASYPSRGGCIGLAEKCLSPCGACSP